MTFNNVSKKLVLVAVSTLVMAIGTGCENKAEERAEQRAENAQSQNALTTPAAPAATTTAPTTGARVCAEGENGTTADGQPCTLPTSRNPASVETNPEE